MSKKGIKVTGKCNGGGCHRKEPEKLHFPCTKCNLVFCWWHLMFLDGTEKEPDASKAECLCCFFGIKRTKKFIDCGMADPLARALKEKNDPAFRDRAIAYRLRYEGAMEDAFAPGGPDLWHPGMAPPPDKDVKEFIKATQEAVNKWATS